MWSRWNCQLNSRSMALLVREIIEKRKTVNHYVCSHILDQSKEKFRENKLRKKKFKKW